MIVDIEQMQGDRKIIESVDWPGVPRVMDTVFIRQSNDRVLAGPVAKVEWIQDAIGFRTRVVLHQVMR